MNENWERIEALLDRFNIKPIVAVIPDNKDPDLFFKEADPMFWDRVRRWQQKGWYIAMHGYEHRFTTTMAGIVPIQQQSEFAGLSLSLQKEKIAAGYKRFQEENIVPTLWVAPAHSFDEQTVDALRAETGIRALSDGIALRPFKKNGFTWIPQQLWKFRNCWWGGVYTVCLHPNTMNEMAFINIEHDIVRYAKKIIDPEIYLSTTRMMDLWDRVFAFLWWNVRTYAKR